mgnify:CR=1 FL=1
MAGNVTGDGHRYERHWRVRVSVSLSDKSYGARSHVGDISEGAVSVRGSRNGKYTAVTVTFEARDQEQLDALYRELSGHERILMVL